MENYKTKEIKDKDLNQDLDSEYNKLQPINFEIQSVLQQIKKPHIAELKAFQNPPAIAVTVLNAVMILLGKDDPNWTVVKKEINDCGNFIKKLNDFDKDNISKATQKKLSKYTKQDTFKLEKCENLSKAVGFLCQWVIQVELYSNILKSEQD